MGFSLGSLAQVLLLCLNAMAILSERRFLAKYGLATSASAEYGGGGQGSLPFGSSDEMSQMRPTSSTLMAQMASMLGSVRMLLRLPLIFINTAVILFTLIFG